MMLRSVYRGTLVPGLMALVLVLAGCSEMPMPNAAKSLADESYAPEVASSMEESSAAGFAMAYESSADTLGVRSRGASVVPAPSAVAGAVLSLVQGAAPVQPYLVKTVEIAIQVEEVSKQSAALQDLAVEMGGYLADLNETATQVSGAYVRMTLRIPVDRLEDTMERIAELGAVLHRNLSTDDVTLQYVDMQSRLRNLEKLETRLLAHLDRTGAMNDILGVERELSRVRGESEQLQGRINDLSNQISFATIRADLSAVPSAGPINPASTFSTGRTFSDAARNLLNFARVLWVVTIWIGVWVPVWVPLAFLMRYGYRKQQEAPKAGQPSPTPPE